METEPILVKSKISTIFIIISVFLCIGVIIFIIINNKSKTPDCKNKCNNADDGAGGKCTKKCDDGMKCIDKTCVCAPDCSDTTKCDNGCGGTCLITDEVCYQGKRCKKKCSNKCKGDSDECGGKCDGPCFTDIIARPVGQPSNCNNPPDGTPQGNVGFASGYWGTSSGLCGTEISGIKTNYPARCADGEIPIRHDADITYNGININETLVNIPWSYDNYCYKNCPDTYNPYSVEDKALFCIKK